MREILFRGKRVVNDEWVEGNFCMSALEQRRGLCGEDGYIRLYDSNKGKMEVYKVDRETVGQYTGLKDKNGKKIFEGDIVRHHNGSLYADSDNIELGKVYWDEKYCGWRRTSNGAFHHGCVDNYRISPDCVYEVVGNIHDNPELLGGDE